MDRNEKPKFCPVCEHPFVPWNIWKITRWTTIKCPNCSAALRREFMDIQFVRMIFIAIGFGLLSNLIAGYFGISALFAYISILIPMFLIDILTVRLQPAGEFRGIRGYKM